MKVEDEAVAQVRDYADALGISPKEWSDLYNTVEYRSVRERYRMKNKTVTVTSKKTYAIQERTVFVVTELTETTSDAAYDVIIGVCGRGDLNEVAFCRTREEAERVMGLLANT